MDDFEDIKINKIEIDEDTLRQLVLDALHASNTIDEVLENKKQEDAMTKKSFKVAWDGYRAVKKSKNVNLMILKTTRLRLQLLRIIALIFNSSSKEILDMIDDKIQEVSSEYISEKDILIQIQKSLKKLQAAKASNCNFEICKLLALLVIKNELLMNSFSEDLDKYRMASRGIDYISSGKTQEELDELNNQIDESIFRLGLKQQKSLVE